MSKNNSYGLQLAIIGGLFFIFGFVTWLNGTLIPFLKLACQLETWQALLVTFAFYMSYFFLALPSAKILQKTGMKNGMALGLAVMAIGCLIFLPAASMRAFPLFLLGLFVQGMGLALLQTASNPYISVIGPIESGAQRISMMGICNKIAGIISPLVLSAIVLKGATAIETQVKKIDESLASAATEIEKSGFLNEKMSLLNELASRVQTPYLAMAVVLGLLALAIRWSPLPEIDPNSLATDSADSVDTSRKTSVFQFQHLVLGAFAIFFCVAAEVMAADAITLYGKRLGFSIEETGRFPSWSLAAMLVGYVLAIFTIPKFFSQQSFLKISAIVGIALTVGIYFLSGKTAIAAIAALGFANAVMWPAIFPLAIRGLGKFTQTGSALLIMGIAGGAIVPQIYGFLESPVGFRAAFLVATLPCYLYIFYYATRGYRAS